MPRSNRARWRKESFSRRAGCPVSAPIKKRTRVPRKFWAPRMKESHERHKRYEASRQDAHFEEDRDLHGEAELQPWPHQGRGGGEEAHHRATPRRVPALSCAS